MGKVLAIALAVLMAGMVAGCDTKMESFTVVETETAAVKPEASDTEQAQENQESSTPGDPIRIGLTAVLTGDRSLEGEYVSNAVKIITGETSTQGGVLGRPIKIMTEDTLGVDVGTVNAYRKLASDDGIVAIVGPDSFNDGMTQSPSVLEFETLTTAQGSSPTLKNMCSNDNPYLSQLRACDDTLYATPIKHLVEELEVKSYTVTYDAETSSADQARLFIEAFKSYDIEPVVIVPSTVGTKDLSSHIAQVQALGADAVIGVVFQTKAAILTQQIRSLGIEASILDSNGFAGSVIIQLAGELNDDTYCASAWVPNTPNPKGAALAEKYREFYSDDYGKTVVQIYDHISVICEAITLVGSTDREAVRGAINTVGNYQGAVTKYNCRTGGNCGRGGLPVKVVKDKAEIIPETTPEKIIEQIRCEQRKRGERCRGEELGA